MAILHANIELLRAIDNIQEKFLRDINVPSEEALKSYNLAPLSCRRDIASLGILHRAKLGKGPQQLQHLFPVATNTNLLVDEVTAGTYSFGPWARNLPYIERSLFGRIKVYNSLDASVRDIPNVKLFQQKLQFNLIERCTEGRVNWRTFYAPR